MYKSRKKKVHFIGVGGIGMSGIAEILISSGYTVSGSDITESDTTRRLASLGATIHYGHKEENLNSADVVVVSSAIDEKNPEIQAARKNKVPIIQRAEMLGELMKMKTSIAIAGTHGKTSTTSMIATIVHHCDLDPTIIIGGKVDALGGNAKLGKGDFLIAEADESDKSFLVLPSTIAIVTNIDNDHLNNYGTLANIKDAFVDFVNRIPFYGNAILCGDDENVKSILPRLKKPYTTYGLSPQADFQARNLEFSSFGSDFEVWQGEKKLGMARCNVPGKHNTLNALAALATGMEIGLTFEQASKGLAQFKGVRRRFELKGEKDGVKVFDDYGHHPTEIKATLAAARKAWKGRVVTCFQPHRYSRTQDCYEDFVKAFDDADVVYIADIYAAGEEPIPGISAEKLAEDIRGQGHRSVEFVGAVKDAAGKIKPSLQSGDLFLTLGAGSIYQVGEALLK
ncbi:MAG: UDP-N-acetylmuramate--L-alanine ligase [Proteobacteria bacterium]|nr:MAG: UDP-N-acetylmuramate--L-alanine ligase [Pseudomonadota bacterium]